MAAIPGGNDDGFRIVSVVLALSETADFLRTIEASPLTRSRAGARHLMKHPAVSGVAKDPRLLAIASGFLGPSAVPYRATLFDKSSARNWLVTWHQDIALPLQERRDVPGWGPWSIKSGIPDHRRRPLLLVQGERTMKAAIYARVSTLEQNCDNQLIELRRYVQARGWTGTEFVDRGVSGAKDRRPALDRLLADARRRRFDVLVCWRLDRLGRNLRHLITLLDDLQALGVAFVSLAEGIDATTPAGKLQMHILGAIAEFERERIRERVMAGLARARAQGKRLGRPQARLPIERLQTVAGLAVDTAAERLGVSRSTVKRWRRQVVDHLSDRPGVAVPTPPAE